MPYTTEKSMIFQVCESWVNGSRSEALEALWHLVGGGRISEMRSVWSANLDPLTGMTGPQRQRHVEEHWWGREEGPPGTWNDQDPYHPVQNPTTGFWAHWYGNAEGIFRETMIRALCISLGLTRQDANQLGPSFGRRKTIPKALRGGTQHWPISILWKCPNPWYEGWIEFKSYPYSRPHDGHVTVVLATPSHGVKLYDTPIRPTGVPPVSNDPYNTYQLNPNAPAGPEGLWVVSQAANALIPAETQPKTPPTTWSPPTLGTPVFSAGAVVTVATALGDGGAAPPGIPVQ
jgi:hypothetical protein